MHSKIFIFSTILLSTISATPLIAKRAPSENRLGWERNTKRGVTMSSMEFSQIYKRTPMPSMNEPLYERDILKSIKSYAEKKIKTLAGKVFGKLSKKLTGNPPSPANAGAAGTPPSPANAAAAGTPPASTPSTAGAIDPSNPAAGAGTPPPSIPDATAAVGSPNPAEAAGPVGHLGAPPVPQ